MGMTTTFAGSSSPSPKLDLNFALNKSLTSPQGIVPSFSRASTGTYFNPSGVLSSAAINEARFDHVYNGTSWESRGLLIEEQRTNLALWSQGFSNAAWTKRNNTITTAAGIAPDGTNTANKFAETITNGQHDAYPTSPVNAGTTVSLSCYMKAAERNWGILFFDTGFRAYFDLSNGTVGTVAGGASASITPVGNGWYRCRISASGANASNYPAIGIAPSDNTQSYTGTAGSGILVWGIQYEAGSFATSYIPTTTGSVTRSADVCQITGSSFSGFWNAAEGSFAVEYDITDLGAIDKALASANDGTGSNHASLYGMFSSSLAGKAGPVVTNAGAAQAAYSLGSVPSINPNRISFCYKLNDFSGSLNGSAVLTDTAGTIPTVNQMHIGRDYSASYLNGHISRLRYFNKRLTDKQLEDLGKPELSKTLDLQFASTKSLVPLAGPTPSFSRASAGWYFNASGVLTQAAINEARFDHTYDGSTWISRGLLVEEQRTNLALWSQGFSNAAWTKASTTVVANSGVAPDGTTTASLAYPTTTGSDRGPERNNGGGTAGQPMATSFYFKAAGKSWVNVGTTDGNVGAYFNIANGTIGTVSAGTATITPVGNGWYRCTHNLGASKVSVAGWSFFRICDANGSTAVTTNGTDGVLVWGAQLEANASAPSSYIPTTTGSVTRSADVCQITGSSFSGMWNASEGSVVCRFARGVQTGAGSTPYSYFAGAESTDLIYLIASGGNESAQVWVGNSPQAQLNTGASPDAGVSRKVSLGFRANDFAASKDGAAVATDASGSVTVCSQVKIGYGMSNYTNGWVESLQHYTIRLPNRLLQQKSS